MDAYIQVGRYVRTYLVSGVLLHKPLDYEVPHCIEHDARWEYNHAVQTLRIHVLCSGCVGKQIGSRELASNGDNLIPAVSIDQITHRVVTS